MWELDHKEGWAPENWCFWTVVLKTLESPLDCKEIKSVNPKGNQSWIFIGRIDSEAPILWPPDAKTWLIGKDPDAGKDWRLEENRRTEDDMVGWHHWLDGHVFEQTPGDGDGQGSLGCCSPWSQKQSDTAKSLNWTEQIVEKYYKAPLNLVRWVLSCLLLMSMSEVFSVTFTLNKINTKLWVTVFGPGVKSSPLETTNPVALFTVSYHLGGSARIFKTGKNTQSWDSFALLL